MTHPAPAYKSFADRTSLYQEITDKIIAEFEQGRVPWVQPWDPLILDNQRLLARPPAGRDHPLELGMWASGIYRPRLFRY